MLRNVTLRLFILSCGRQGVRRRGGAVWPPETHDIMHDVERNIECSVKESQ